jgi:hypothetical protein
MRGCRIEQLGQGDHGSSRTFALLCRESVEGDEHGRINGASIKKERAQDLLHSFGVGGVEKRGSVFRRRTLRFATIIWFLPGMGRIFGGRGSTVLKSLKGSVDASRHGYAASSGVVIPIEGEAAASVVWLPSWCCRHAFFKGGN